MSASYEYYVDTVEELEHSPGEEPAAAEGLPSLRICSGVAARFWKTHQTTPFCRRDTG